MMICIEEKSREEEGLTSQEARLTLAEAVQKNVSVCIDNILQLSTFVFLMGRMVENRCAEDLNINPALKPVVRKTKRSRALKPVLQTSDTITDSKNYKHWQVVRTVSSENSDDLRAKGMLIIKVCGKAKVLWKRTP
ncbi:hypothetical protein C5167_034082 [Papaver somniferum]|uniref:Uncharacterized protein n=1 Tax=Papaver somniferum TaxID=3469 RepID=A0A4Y7KDK6_PAPSO|nr:hypothetical protein C5167_034082 [Papaver somniferum]